jgi:predicted MFS family arabinose efflux permease
MIGAIRAGMRYARHSPALRAVLVRSGVFIVCGAALWALLPLLARDQLGLSAVGYGVLLGCLGAGAITGAVLLPRIRRKVSLDALVAGATVCFAGVTLALAYVRDVYLVGAMMAPCGVAWMALMSSFNTAAQTSVPAWVRARALALYLLVFQGGTAVGSLLWGTLAARVGIPAALVCAAMGLMAGLAVSPAIGWREGNRSISPHRCIGLSRTSSWSRTLRTDLCSCWSNT